MIKIAVYGKGGIGKSTTISNIAVALANQGLKVLQIGCDPKADSTSLLHHKSKMRTVLQVMKEKGNQASLQDMVTIGYKDIVCVEAGGPTPGLGCAGRGIIAALEEIKKKGIYETYEPDAILYDVLGDVVCGGFSMPMRKGYADQVLIVTSGENMSIYAAANIATAIKNFNGRGYAKLAGLVLNCRNVKDEEEKVKELAKDFQTSILAKIPRSDLILQAEEENKTLMEAFPESEIGKAYEDLAKKIIEISEE